MLMSLPNKTFLEATTLLGKEDAHEPQYFMDLHGLTVNFYDDKQHNIHDQNKK